MSKSKTKKDRRMAKAVGQVSVIEDEPKIVKPAVKKTEESLASALGFGYGARLVRPSMQLFKDNFESCLIMFVLPSLLLTLGSLLVGNGMHATGMTLIGALLAVVGFCWYVVSLFAGGMFSLAVARGEQPGVRRYYRRGLRFAPRLIGLTLVIFPLFVAGLCLFVVPGLIVLRRYSLAYYYLVDHNLGVREALDMSAAQTKPEPMAVFGVAAVLALFITIGSAFGRTVMPYGSILALIVEILYLLAPALLYVELQKRYLAKEQADVLSTDSAIKN